MVRNRVICDICGNEIKGDPRTRIMVQRLYILGAARQNPVPLFGYVDLNLCWDCDREMMKYIRAKKGNSPRAFPKRCFEPEENSVKTNADRIRAMSDKEFKRK